MVSELSTEGDAVDLTVNCDVASGNDGALVLTPPRSTPIPLDKQLSIVWEFVTRLVSLPLVDQRGLLLTLEPADRAKLFEAVDHFEATGCLRSGTAGADSASGPNQPDLRKLHLEVTHRCNFACRACYLGRYLKPGTASRTGEGTTVQWLDVVREAAELGCRYATVTGGEPFLRPDLLEILAALTDAGIVIDINTNGSCLTSAKATALRSMLIRSVQVTVYGQTPDEATAYTGRPSSYSSTMRGISALVAAEIPVGVKYFASGDDTTGGRLEAELGALGLKAYPIRRFLHADVFDGRRATEGLSFAKEGGPDVEQLGSLPCYPSVSGLAIAADGAARPCPKLAAPLGNAFRTGLRQLWYESAEVRAFRSFWPEFATASGFVRGSVHPILCPAVAMLKREDGLSSFLSQWHSARNRESLPPC